jgi:hypothetical protein
MGGAQVDSRFPSQLMADLAFRSHLRLALHARLRAPLCFMPLSVSAHFMKSLSEFFFRCLAVSFSLQRSPSQ